MTSSKVSPAELGLRLLKIKIKREGLTLGKNADRDLGNLAKEVGVPIEEIRHFIATEILPDLICETLGFRKVRLDWS